MGAVKYRVIFFLLLFSTIVMVETRDLNLLCIK